MISCAVEWQQLKNGSPTARLWHGVCAEPTLSTKTPLYRYGALVCPGSHAGEDSTLLLVHFLHACLTLQLPAQLPAGRNTSVNALGAGELSHPLLPNTQRRTQPA